MEWGFGRDFRDVNNGGRDDRSGRQLWVRHEAKPGLPCHNVCDRVNEGARSGAVAPWIKCLLYKCGD